MNLDRTIRRLAQRIEVAFPPGERQPLSRNTADQDLIWCAEAVGERTWNEITPDDLAGLGECLNYWDAEISVRYLPGLMTATLGSYLAPGDSRYGEAFVTFVPNLYYASLNIRELLSVRQRRLVGEFALVCLRMDNGDCAEYYREYCGPTAHFMVSFLRPYEE